MNVYFMHQQGEKAGVIGIDRDENPHQGNFLLLRFDSGWSAPEQKGLAMETWLFLLDQRLQACLLLERPLASTSMYQPPEDSLM